jgi:hypothetical protein
MNVVDRAMSGGDAICTASTSRHHNSNFAVVDAFVPDDEVEAI